MTTEFANIDLIRIVSSLTNPRKTFNLLKMGELIESIKASGVHQPILVRPLPGSRVEETSREPDGSGKLRFVRPTHEIVSGERRFRASKAAGLLHIPAMIRELSDDQVREIQIVENLQRDDLTELEEAEGYEQLMQHSGMNVDAVAAKIGKSRAYVYARTKLLDLSLESKQALRDGQVDFSRAVLIARIPDSALQAKALAEATRPDYRGDVPSVRALQTWLKANVMLRLESASFKITDARLVQSAGSCKDCPKRTGANPDLFADVDGADICTDPACYHGKEDAHRAKLRAQAEKKGIRLIEGAEAKELIAHQYSTRIDGYSPLGQVREDCAAEGGPAPTLRELLGDDAPGVVLIENPFSKELIEAVPTEEAEAMLLAKGLLKSEPPQATAKATLKALEQELAYLERRFKIDEANAASKAVNQATVQAVRATDAKMAVALVGSTFLRAWLSFQLDSVENSYMATALGYTFQEGEDEVDGLTQHIKSCTHADLCRAAVLCALREEDHYGGDDSPVVRNCLTTALDVPVKAITAKAIKAVKAEYTAKVKAIQAQIDAQNSLLPQTPLAQPMPATGAKPNGAKPAAARKPKMSADEAKSGIAAAMQGMEQAQTAAPDVQQSDQAKGFDVGVKVRVVAAAMQGMEQAASAPIGAVALPSAADRAAQLAAIGIGLPVGQRITVLVGKYKGKQGAVIESLGDDCYRVKVDRVSVASGLRMDQMEVAA